MGKTFVAIGECMLELRPASNGSSMTNLPGASMDIAYAGDTYNALVYGKRLSPELTTCFFSAVGTDAMSQSMLERWRLEGINTSYCQRIGDKTIGIYSISTDNLGERSFSYWRNDSAARSMLAPSSDEVLLTGLENVELIFFSGISLGILSDADKNRLLTLLSKLRERGSTIAFDPNYRPAMWNGLDHVKDYIRRAYEVSDIALPGVDEHQLIFNHQDKNAVIEFCQNAGCQEIVVKDGNNGTWVAVDGQLYHQAFEAAPVQLDSTAAGDSFAGSYLAARLIGDSAPMALSKACFVAREVVQVPGAIMELTDYSQRVLPTIARLS